MPAYRRERTVAAPQQRIWELISNPSRLPEWWPGVQRVEAIEPEHWTEVHATKRGRPVRIDFRLVQSDPPWLRTWLQEIEGTPFERVLKESITEIKLEPAPSATKVSLAQYQQLRGYSRTGGYLLRRATIRRLAEALEGVERASLGGQAA
jgi:carbon monoxide dehydrogenase subunit G